MVHVHYFVFSRIVLVCHKLSRNTLISRNVPGPLQILSNQRTPPRRQHYSFLFAPATVRGSRCTVASTCIILLRMGASSLLSLLGFFLLTRLRPYPFLSLVLWQSMEILPPACFHLFHCSCTTSPPKVLPTLKLLEQQLASIRRLHTHHKLTPPLTPPLHTVSSNSIALTPKPWKALS